MNIIDTALDWWTDPSEWPRWFRRFTVILAPVFWPLWVASWAVILIVTMPIALGCLLWEKIATYWSRL